MRKLLAAGRYSFILLARHRTKDQTKSNALGFKAGLNVSGFRSAVDYPD